MAKSLGAARPAFKRKVLLIAVAAVLLVFAWAKAGFPCPQSPCQWFQMGPDGVMGMMPPGGYGAPGPKSSKPPSGSGSNSGPSAMTFAVERRTVDIRPAAIPVAVPGPVLTLKQRSDNTGQTYEYAASSSPLTRDRVYLVKREGKPWLAVTYNKATGLYELTDPNGTGSPVLKLGANPKYALIPNSSTH